MKKTQKTILFILANLIGLNCLFLTPVYAEENNKGGASTTASSNVCDSSASDEVKRAAGCSGNSDALKDIVLNILRAIIAVTGIIAVVFIVIGGINYMTSTGDPGKVEKAKKTIIYALIGLAVCALAIAIVNWAISTVNNSGGGTVESGKTGLVPFSTSLI